MSFSYDNLREIITKKFMSVSVSHAPQKDPNFVEDVIVEPSSGSSSRNSALTSSVSGTYGEERSSEPYDQVIKKDPLPVVENLVKPEFLKGDELTREFSFDRDIKVPHVLHLCMYKLNKVLQQPFLEFYVIKNNIEYEFPNKELSPELFEQFVEKEPEEEKIEPIVEEIVGGEPQDIDQAFSDQISAFFQEQTGSPLAIENYKGFLEINNNIFAIIETNKELLDVKENLVSIIIDEIINKRTLTISSNVLDLFTNNKILTKIGENIPPPRVLYLCENKGGVYKNIYYEKQEVPHYTIINDKVLHPTFKNIYLFSETPLPSETPIELIKRYVAFSDTLTRLDDEPDGNHYWFTRSLLSFVEI